MSLVGQALLDCSYSDESATFERHFHNAHEIIYVCDGSVGLQIGGSSYTIGPETLVFIGKLEEHKLQVISEPYRRYFLQLTPAQLDHATGDPMLKSIFLSRPNGFCHSLNLSGTSIPVWGNTESVFQAMLTEHRSDLPYANSTAMALLKLLLIHCYRISPASFPFSTKRGRKWWCFWKMCYRISPASFPFSTKRFGKPINEIQQYIDENFTKDIRLDDLATRFYISPSYLSHSFREWIGSSPKQYIVRSRIAYARELLVTTSDPVNDIALRCGFGDTSNFIRSFYKETAMTPLQYRKFYK